MSAPPGTGADWPSLLVDGRLERVPGGPYDAEAVDIAVSTVRGECGWHIAPVIRERVLLDGGGGRELLLPTLRLLDVVEVRAADHPLPVTEYEWSQAGTLTRWQGWPRRKRSVMVVMDHGHDACPAELVGLIAELAGSFRAVPAGVRSSSRTVGGVTTNRTFTESGPVQQLLGTFSHVLDRYRVSVPT